MKARENPFAVNRVLGVRYRPLHATWEVLVDRLRQLHYRAAIVGPEGSGKTTLLEDLALRLSSLGLAPRLIRLYADEPLPPRGIWIDSVTAELNGGTVLLCDGAEQLGRHGLAELVCRCRTAGGLVVTAHRSTQLPTWVHCHTHPALAAQVVEHLVGPLDDRLRALVDQLYTRYAGNIRSVLRDLYDRCAHDQLQLPARVG